MKSNISLQKVDELLAEVDVARTLAREAVARAEKTLAEANETLQILLGRYLMLVLVYCSKWIKIKSNNKECPLSVLKFLILNLIRSGAMLIHVHVFGFIMNRSKILEEVKCLGIYHMHVRNVVGFNKQVEESKGKAQDAIKKIPDIENLIKRAENKTQEARDALSGAESDANEALSLAQLAQVTATNASMVKLCSTCMQKYKFVSMSKYFQIQTTFYF